MPKDKTLNPTGSAKPAPKPTKPFTKSRGNGRTFTFTPAIAPGAHVSHDPIIIPAKDGKPARTVGQYHFTAQTADKKTIRIPITKNGTPDYDRTPNPLAPVRPYYDAMVSAKKGTSTDQPMTRAFVEVRDHLSKLG